MDRASSKLGPRYKEGLDVFQAQVVIKATLFLAAMYFILEAINYYYYYQERRTRIREIVGYTAIVQRDLCSTRCGDV